MPTATERRRLIEGIAFIESHDDLWQQGCWVSIDDQIERNTCGTVGCLAGHIAITLNPSQPVVKVSKEILQKPAADRTEKEDNLINALYASADYVRPTRADQRTELIWVNGKDVRVTHVRVRAARLIGYNTRDAEEGLFSGTNTLDDIYDIAAEDLDMTVEELHKATKRVARENGWIKSRAKVGA